MAIHKNAQKHLELITQFIRNNINEPDMSKVIDRAKRTAENIKPDYSINIGDFLELIRSEMLKVERRYSTDFVHIKEEVLLWIFFTEAHLTLFDRYQPSQDWETVSRQILDRILAHIMHYIEMECLGEHRNLYVHMPPGGIEIRKRIVALRNFIKYWIFGYPTGYYGFYGGYEPNRLKALVKERVMGYENEVFKEIIEKGYKHVLWQRVFDHPYDDGSW